MTKQTQNVLILLAAIVAAAFVIRKFGQPAAAAAQPATPDQANVEPKPVEASTPAADSPAARARQG